MIYMYIWRKGVLTAYSDGIAVAVTDSVDSARKMILQEYWNGYIEGTGCEQWQEEDGWPMSEYIALRNALNEEPEIKSLPTCCWKNGGD